MGSGKSTVGQGLAKELNLQFIDLDNYIEERNFMTIPEIFASAGEDGFRKVEQHALKELSEFENVVVATGGGTPCFFDNMELIKRTGISVFLNGSPRILAERLMVSKTERPLIKGKSREELAEFIHETLNKRDYWYKQADLIIDFDSDLKVPEVLEMLDTTIKKL
jgi:shikimate kinase